jgi:ribosomal protein S18 acetylase RimI-like enzyme
MGDSVEQEHLVLEGPTDVVVEEALGATDELVEALAALVPQLSSSAPAPTAAEIDEIAASPASTLFVARGLDGKVLGALTLATFRVPTGVRAWIEDVVVDDAARGRGVGAALVRAAIAKAEAAGSRTVDLTSRPSRQAANRLYQRLGFATRQTNVYRWSAES